MLRSQPPSIAFPQLHGSINQLNYLNELELGVLLFITKDLFATSAPMHIVTTSLWKNIRGESWKGGGGHIAEEKILSPEATQSGTEGHQTIQAQHYTQRFKLKHKNRLRLV